MVRFMINNAYKLRDDFLDLAAISEGKQMEYLEKKTKNGSYL